MPVKDKVLPNEQTAFSLKIDFAITKLTKNSKFRDYTIKAVAEECGFKTQQSFSAANFSILKVKLASSYVFEAINLPLTSKQSILDIAMTVGFNSKTAFYDAFKRQVKVTPTQCRNDLNHKPLPFHLQMSHECKS